MSKICEANFGQIAKSTFTGGFWGGAGGFFAFAGGEGGKEFLGRLFRHSFSQAWLEGIRGGNMKHGLMAGMASAAGGEAIMEYAGNASRAVKTALNAVVGGTASELGGGKFTNGAMTGAFVMMFNDLMHQEQEKAATGGGAEITADMINEVIAGLPADGTSSQFMGIAVDLLNKYPNAYVRGSTIKAFLQNADAKIMTLLDQISQINKSGNIINIVSANDIKYQVDGVPILGSINLRISTKNSIEITTLNTQQISLSIKGVNAGLGINRADITPHLIKVRYGPKWITMAEF